MARRIACGHCGGSHGSVAEVRTCSQGSHPAPGSTITTNLDHDPASDREPASPAAQYSGQGRPAGEDRAAGRSRPSTGSEAAAGNGVASPTTTPTATRAARATRATPGRRADATILGVAAEVLAGPPALGRSVILHPDAAVPSPWQGLAEIKADADSDQDVVDALQRAWRARERLIIRWSGPLPSADPELSKPFHQWTVDLELPGERLAFAVTANAVNLLGDDPAFEPVAMALSRGAELAPADSPSSQHTPDKPAVTDTDKPAATDTDEPAATDTDKPGVGEVRLSDVSHRLGRRWSARPRPARHPERPGDPPMPSGLRVDPALGPKG